LSHDELVAIFGSKLNVAGTDPDLFHLGERVAASTEAKPRLFIWCGTEDPLIDDNRRFHRHLTSLKLEHTYEESAGTHEWSYWDTQIQRVLDWLPLR
jgi:putative tributyrin esterase